MTIRRWAYPHCEVSNDVPRDGDRSIQPEEIEDALIDGDRPLKRGTARAALQSPLYRAVFLGALASNIGTWMQNITLAAWAFTLTGSEAFVSLVVFAQLGPMLVFTLIGGTLADLLDRRKLLIAVAITQSLLSLGLAALATSDDPSRAGIIAIVLAIGIGQAIHAPTFTSVLPTLVPREDLPGAISLQSANLNASRVVGPAIGGVLMGIYGPTAVFLVNALSFLVIIVVLSRIRFPAPPPTGDERGLKRVLLGFTVARRDRVVGRCLLTMALFSFFCLPFVGQMAALAERNLGIEAESAAYGVLYATFALGALIGALSIGTFLAGKPLESVVRFGLGGFAVALAVFALLRDAIPAYPVGLAVGFFYFATVTSLSTVLQSRISDAQRGRVMAVWIMAFGGTVPVGGIVFGPLMEITSITAVLLFAAMVAVVLVGVANLRDRQESDVSTAAG